jgi:hypothetical protein
MKNTTRVQVVCPTIRDEVLYCTVDAIDLVGCAAEASCYTVPHRHQVPETSRNGQERKESSGTKNLVCC